MNEPEILVLAYADRYVAKFQRKGQVGLGNVLTIQLSRTEWEKMEMPSELTWEDAE